MGIDWCPMRLRPEVPRGELNKLIQAQASAFMAMSGYYWDCVFRGTGGSVSHREDPELCRKYNESDSALRACLLPVDAETPEGCPGERVYTITGNLLLPMEWRYEAMRSYLPEDLSAALKRWRAYFQAASEGSYQPYLQRLYLYQLGLDLHERWQVLIEQARSVSTRTNTWAQRPALIELCVRIEKLPPPTLHPAPLWSYWRSVASGGDGVEEEIQNRSWYDDELARLTRSFDAKVPGNWKVRYYTRFTSFLAFVSQGQQSDLQDYLAWLEACSAEGYVLYLD